MHWLAAVLRSIDNSVSCHTNIPLPRCGCCSALGSASSATSRARGSRRARRQSASPVALWAFGSSRTSSLLKEAAAVPTLCQLPKKFFASVCTSTSPCSWRTTYRTSFASSSRRASSISVPASTLAGQSSPDSNTCGAAK